MGVMVTEPLSRRRSTVCFPIDGGEEPLISYTRSARRIHSYRERSVVNAGRADQFGLVTSMQARTRLVWIVACVLALVGCSQQSADPVEDTVGASPIAVTLNETEAVGLWVVESSDLPQDPALPSASDRALKFRILVVNGTDEYAVSLGFDNCSQFGGPVSVLDPLTYSSTTVAGVGGCGDEDAYASTLLRRLEGAEISYNKSSDTLLVQQGDIALSMSRLP